MLGHNGKRSLQFWGKIILNLEFYIQLSRNRQVKSNHANIWKVYLTCILSEKLPEYVLQQNKSENKESRR